MGRVSGPAPAGNPRAAPRPVPYVVHVLHALRGIKTTAVPSLHRTVLIALAEHANPDGSGCWPSVATIAAAVGVARHRVCRVLAELESALWITREGRTRPSDGGQTSTLYRVRLGGGPITVRERVRPGRRALQNKPIPLPEGVADLAARRARRVASASGTPDKS